MPIDTADLCARYRALYMPAVCDALYHLGLPEQVLPTSLRPLFPERRIVGIAFTVRGQAIEPRVAWEPGIERIRSYLRVFERLEPDSLLVHVNGSSVVGHFGELTANSARERGCVGCILDGNLRDVEGLREIGFQVFYRDLSPLNAIGRWEMVAAQEPVTIGQVTVRVRRHPRRAGRRRRAGAREGRGDRGRGGGRAGGHACGRLAARRPRDARLHLMPAPIVVPQTGLVEEVAIVEWLRADGDAVAAGEPVVVVESEKAQGEVEAPAAGVLRIEVAAGPDPVPVETVLGYVD
jgi:regulator of RNase E activity RraA